ncbi:cyclic nucleotide-binding domain-containing protein, partial [Haematococcus lacustris]
MAVLRGEPTQQQLIILGFLRTPRLLRLGRLVRMLDRLKGGNGIRVFVLICTMVFLAHWLACIWYMLYRFTTFADYTEWGMFVGGLISEEAKLSAYISAYYQSWLLCVPQSFLLLVGNNQPSHNNLERVFMVLVLILGAIFYSAVVGQMAVLVATMNTVGLRHRTKEDQTMDVLRYIGLPDSQKARVQAYFTYVTQFNHPGN